jgi:serine/threonine protein kinase
MSIVAASGKTTGAPDQILGALRRVGVLEEAEFERASARLLGGRYDAAPNRLAARLVRDGILTEYQARCALHGLADRLSIGQYILLDPLGRGSMGRVYRARHRALGRTVALKVIESSRLAQR